MEWEFDVSRCKPLYMKWVNNKILLYSTGNCIQYPLINHHAAAKSLQSCPTLCDPIDGSPPGSTIPGILQARTLEWVAISFSHNALEIKIN